jgi:hypothetical protein
MAIVDFLNFYCDKAYIVFAIGSMGLKVLNLEESTEAPMGSLFGTEIFSL